MVCGLNAHDVDALRAPMTDDIRYEDPSAPKDVMHGIHGMDRNELRGDRLCRHQIFWDMAEFGRQIGVFPKRGSRSEKLSRHLQHLAARGARLRR